MKRLDADGIHGREPGPGKGPAASRASAAASRCLNVALGGTLYQDILSQVPESICHNPKTDKAVNTHTVRIEARQPPATSILGKREIWVNGKHHQAHKGSRHPGWWWLRGPRDGVIEAVEHPGQTLCHRGSVASRGDVAG
ncbi:MAG: gamma-glutamyl-gamma-aminobutyrate hydrolase family protein [Desulfomicrobium escambiense]|nr:gamma-glutamyl-gamma-aminobutyrate hydrolase family protein [Desulfomicrobium escambiense]